MRGMLLFVAFLPALSTAQQICTSQPFSVSAILADGRVIQNVKPEQLRATIAGKPVKIAELHEEQRPRRILLVVENGKRVQGKARDLVVDTLKNVVDNAREEDQFALVTLRGPSVQLPFGSSRGQLLEALEQLRSQPRSQDEITGMLDAILSATDFFHEAATGDAIIAEVVDFEPPGRVAPEKFVEALTTKGIQMFGLALGPAAVGALRVSSPVAGAHEGPLWSFDSIYSDIIDLTWRTGGYHDIEITNNVQREYQPTTARIEELRTTVWRMYSAIVSSYSVQLDRPFSIKSNARLKFELLLPNLQNAKPQVLSRWTVPPCT